MGLTNGCAYDSNMAQCSEIEVITICNNATNATLCKQAVTVVSMIRC